MSNKELPPTARPRPGDAASAKAARRFPAGARSSCTGAAALAGSALGLHPAPGVLHIPRMTIYARRPLEILFNVILN